MHKKENKEHHYSHRVTLTRQNFLGANGVAEQTIQEVRKRMNTIGPKEWMKWHKHLRDIEQAIRAKPVLLTALSPAEIVYETNPNIY